MPRIAPPPIQDNSTLDRLDERMANLIQQVIEFRNEYKETNREIRKELGDKFGEASRKQDEQFAVVIKRITDLETWKSTEVQPTRIMGWDAAAKKVDDYLDDKHVTRREQVFRAVEAHMNDNGKIESLIWLTRARDRWGFLLTIIGAILGLISGLFYWLLDNFILPWIQGSR